MTVYKVKAPEGEWIEVKLCNNSIICESLRDPKDGKWPACLAPYERESYKPHYSFDTYEDYDGSTCSIYKAEFFVEDLEYDSFIVEVIGAVDLDYEVSMHNCHTSKLTAGDLMAIAFTVEEIECVLKQIAPQHDKVLGIKMEEV